MWVPGVWVITAESRKSHCCSFSSAASVLHKCVYRKNIKSTMDNSLPFPRLINFSRCWQIFTWAGIECERWMCKSTAGGSWVWPRCCSVYVLFVSVVSAQPRSWPRTQGRLSSRAWGATASPVSPDSSPPWESKQQEDSPVTTSRDWQRAELGVFCIAFWYFSWWDTAFHSTVNVDTAWSGLFYDTSLVDSIAWMKPLYLNMLFFVF